MRRRNRQKSNTKPSNWQKSVKLGINSPFPQMPSIVPCLDKASKSGWKMQAPFLYVRNYYPFVLSGALLSSSSWVCSCLCECLCVQTASSVEETEPKSMSHRGHRTQLMFDVATKLITMTPAELLRAWRGLTTDTTHQLVAAWSLMHAWMCELRVYPESVAKSFSFFHFCRCPSHTLMLTGRLHLFFLTLHSSCTPIHPLSLSFLPFCVFVPKLQSNSFLRAVLLEFNPPSLPFQPLFHCENLGSDLVFLASGPAHPHSHPPTAALLISPPRAFSSIPASLYNPAPWTHSPVYCSYVYSQWAMMLEINA